MGQPALQQPGDGSGAPFCPVLVVVHSCRRRAPRRDQGVSGVRKRSRGHVKKLRVHIIKCNARKRAHAGPRHEMSVWRESDGRERESIRGFAREASVWKGSDGRESEIVSGH